MLDTKLRGWWDKAMRPVGRALARTPLSPNAITLLGVAIQVGVAYLILEGRLVAAGLIAIAAAFFDTFDGALAKAKGRTSKFGAFLDSSTDRVADALYFGPIAWLYGVDPDIAARDEPWVAAVTLVAMVASFMVSYVKARAEALGFDCKVGLFERAERLALLVIALVFSGLLPTLMVVLAVGSVVTVFQRMFHVYGQARSA